MLITILAVITLIAIISIPSLIYHFKLVKRINLKDIPIDYVIGANASYDPPPEVINPILVTTTKWARVFREQLLRQSDDAPTRWGYIRVTSERGESRQVDEYAIDIWVLNRVQRQRPLVVIHALKQLLNTNVVHFTIGKANSHQLSKKRKARKVKQRSLP